MIPPELQNFVAEPQPAGQPSAEPQGQVQGQADPQQAQSEQYRNLQSLYNRTWAENQALQQRLARLETPQAPQAQPERNPYDFNTDYPNWQRWENGQTAKLAAQEVMGNLMGLAKQQAELSWAQAHPEVDINTVKAFAQSRGIQDLNDAYLVMTYPQQQLQIAATTAQQAFNNVRQQPMGATPVRGSSAGGAQVVLSYAKLAQEFQQTNGRAYDSWPKQLQEMFDRETALRAGSR